MADFQEGATKTIRFEELSQNASGVPTIRANEKASISPDNHKDGIRLYAGYEGKPLHDMNFNGKSVEASNSEGKKIDLDKLVDVEVFPAEDGGYKVTNPHPQQEMSVWVYGEEIKIKPGDTVDVPANKPDKYKDLEGVESGTFYISAGTDQAIKVSRKPLSNEVSIKNFSIDKKASGHQDYVKNQPSIDLHNSSVDWEASKIQHNDQGDSIFPIIVDSDKSELGGQIRVDQSGRVILTPNEKYFSAWVKDNRYPQGMNMSGDIVLTSETYFRIGDKVFIYEGLKKDGTPRIVEVKK